MQNARMKPPSMDDVVSMFQASGLKSKLIFTFAMIAVFRLGVALPLFGINSNAISNLAQGNSIPERFKGKPGDILIGMDISILYTNQIESNNGIHSRSLPLYSCLFNITIL